MDLLVGTDGRVKEARLAQSSGSAQLDETALSEVKRSWKLQPAVVDGKPVERWGRFSVTFRLEK